MKISYEQALALAKKAGFLMVNINDDGHYQFINHFDLAGKKLTARQFWNARAKGEPIAEVLKITPYQHNYF